MSREGIGEPGRQAETAEAEAKRRGRWLEQSKCFFLLNNVFICFLFTITMFVLVVVLFFL